MKERPTLQPTQKVYNCNHKIPATTQQDNAPKDRAWHFGNARSYRTGAKWQTMCMRASIGSLPKPSQTVFSSGSTGLGKTQSIAYTYHICLFTLLTSISWILHTRDSKSLQSTWGEASVMCIQGQISLERRHAKTKPWDSVLLVLLGCGSIHPVFHIPKTKIICSSSAKWLQDLQVPNLANSWSWVLTLTYQWRESPPTNPGELTASATAQLYPAQLKALRAGRTCSGFASMSQKEVHYLDMTAWWFIPDSKY